GIPGGSAGPRNQRGGADADRAYGALGAWLVGGEGLSNAATDETRMEGSPKRQRGAVPSLALRASFLSVSSVVDAHSALPPRGWNWRWIARRRSRSTCVYC